MTWLPSAIHFEGMSIISTKISAGRGCASSLLKSHVGFAAGFDAGSTPISALEDDSSPSQSWDVSERASE